MEYPKSDFLSSDDYWKEEQNLLGRLYALPKLNSLEGWLYFHFRSIHSKSKRNMPIDINNDRGDFLDESKMTYTLSHIETSELNEGKFEQILKKEFDSFHTDLRCFFLKFVNRNDFDMLTTFARAIYYLQEIIDVYPYNKGTVISKDLNRNHFLTLIKRRISELVTELAWRINRLNPNNYYNFNANDKEIEKFFKTIVRKGLSLKKPLRFSKNSEEILKKFKDEAILEDDLTLEDLNDIFSSEKVIFSRSFVWKQPLNSLSYFLRTLYEKNKLSHKNYYQLAQNIFINSEGKKIKNLKDNHTIPNIAQKIDLIVSYF